MTRLQKFLQTRATTDMMIFTAYKDFKRFMCCDELPNFKINYVDSLADSKIDYYAQILPYHKPIILNVDINYIKSPNFKKTLVHEFTHLYDYVMVSKKYSNTEMKDFMKLYSEYHASQIEVLYSYKVVNTVQDNVDKYSLKFECTDIIKQRMDSFVTRTQRYVNNPNAMTLYGMKVAYMYSCGATDLLGTIMERSFKKPKFFKEYNDEMSQIAELLSSTNYKVIPETDFFDNLKELNIKTDAIFLEKVQNQQLP